jgi:thiamine pyrophosphokinase
MEFSLLICNGAVPHQNLALFLAHCADHVVCADGGANQAYEYGVRPELIIGDLDSLRCDARVHFETLGVEIRRLRDQEDTDFEKALKYLRDAGVKNLAVLGLTGRLLDHTLGNLSILMRYVNDFAFIIYDEHYRIDVLRSERDFSATPGGRVSLIPLLAAEDISTSGLAYPLQREALIFGEREGTCNTALSSSFRIELSKGTLLVFRELCQENWLP